MSKLNKEKKCCISLVIGLVFICSIVAVYVSIFMDNDNTHNFTQNNTLDTTLYGSNIDIIEAMIVNKTLQRTKCLIKKITYPMVMPFSCHDNSSNNMWGICNCGDNCTSWAPEITLFVEHMNNSQRNSYMLYSLNIYNNSADIIDTHNYTYFNDKCMMNQKFSIEYYKDIIDKFKNSSKLVNTTISCLYNHYNDMVFDLDTVLDTETLQILPIKPIISLNSFNTTTTTTTTSESVIGFLENLFKDPLAISIILLILIIVICCCICVCRFLCF